MPPDHRFNNSLVWPPAVPEPHVKKFMVPPRLPLTLACALMVLLVRAEHRATRPGNPAFRFAPPVATPDNRRARFRSEKLRPDIAKILRQWGWSGDLADLHAAAQRAEIADTRLPYGTRMPFMSSRENGMRVPQGRGLGGQGTGRGLRSTSPRTAVATAAWCPNPAATLP
jgi:hypothetical protein